MLPSKLGIHKINKFGHRHDTTYQTPHQHPWHGSHHSCSMPSDPKKSALFTDNLPQMNSIYNIRAPSCHPTSKLSPFILKGTPFGPQTPFEKTNPKHGSGTLLPNYHVSQLILTAPVPNLLGMSRKKTFKIHVKFFAFSKRWPVLGSAGLAA